MSLVDGPIVGLPKQIQRFANLAAFPGTGESDTYYIADDTGFLYQWNGAIYKVIAQDANYVLLTSAQVIAGLKTLSNTLKILTTTSEDNLRLEKSNSTTHWLLNAGRVAFFDNWILFKNSAEVGNFTIAFTQEGRVVADDGVAGSTAYRFKSSSNSGMWYTGSAVCISQAGFDIFEVERTTIVGTVSRARVMPNSLLGLPRMTTATRDTIAAGDLVGGDCIYNTTTNKAQCWNGATWNDLF